MNPIISNLERAIRMVLALIMLATCSSELISGNLTWPMVFLSLFLAATGVWGYCPTYRLLNSIVLTRNKK
ncbi:MAG: DUF2892 domain-containing protein [Bacteroidota bacterium]